ncbi:hypothetical protein D3248_01450 [Leucobacter zeae]|nr:hypothetical protein [Leucobacter zeae]
MNAAIEELPGYQGAMAGTGADGASDEPVAMGALGIDSAVGAVSVQAICEDTSGAERTATVRINDGEPVELPCVPNGGLQSVASGIAPEGDEVRVVFEGLPGTAAWGFGVVADDE